MGREYEEGRIKQVEETSNLHSGIATRNLVFMVGIGRVTCPKFEATTSGAPGPFQVAQKVRWGFCAKEIGCGMVVFAVDPLIQMFR